MLAAPLLLAYRLRVISFRGGSETLSLIPGMPGMFVRRAWYERTLAACGEGLSVSIGAVFHRPETRVGRRCHLGAYSWVGKATIGDDFMCGSHVVLLSGRHHHGVARTASMADQATTINSITIGDDVWVGTQCAVGADVAAHSIVAAGAIVMSDSSDEWAVLAGVPARKIRDRPL